MPKRKNSIPSLRRSKRNRLSDDDISAVDDNGDQDLGASKQEDTFASNLENNSEPENQLDFLVGDGDSDSGPQGVGEEDVAGSAKAEDVAGSAKAEDVAGSAKTEDTVMKENSPIVLIDDDSQDKLEEVEVVDQELELDFTLEEDNEVSDELVSDEVKSINDGDINSQSGGLSQESQCLKSSESHTEIGEDVVCVSVDLTPKLTETLRLPNEPSPEIVEISLSENGDDSSQLDFHISDDDNDSSKDIPSEDVDCESAVIGENENIGVSDINKIIPNDGGGPSGKSGLEERPVSGDALPPNNDILEISSVKYNENGESQKSECVSGGEVVKEDIIDADREANVPLNEVECLDKDKVDCLEQDKIECLEKEKFQCLEQDKVEVMEQDKVECLEQDIVEEVEQDKVECLVGVNSDKTEEAENPNNEDMGIVKTVGEIPEDEGVQVFKKLRAQILDVIDSDRLDESTDTLQLCLSDDDCPVTNVSSEKEDENAKNSDQTALPSSTDCIVKKKDALSPVTSSIEHNSHSDEPDKSLLDESEIPGSDNNEKNEMLTDKAISDTSKNTENLKEPGGIDDLDVFDIGPTTFDYEELNERDENILLYEGDELPEKLTTETENDQSINATSVESADKAETEKLHASEDMCTESDGLDILNNASMMISNGTVNNLKTAADNDISVVPVQKEDKFVELITLSEDDDDNVNEAKKTVDSTSQPVVESAVLKRPWGAAMIKTSFMNPLKKVLVLIKKLLYEIGTKQKKQQQGEGGKGFVKYLNTEIKYLVEIVDIQKEKVTSFVESCEAAIDPEEIIKALEPELNGKTVPQLIKELKDGISLIRGALLHLKRAVEKRAAILV